MDPSALDEVAVVTGRESVPLTRAMFDSAFRRHRLAVYRYARARLGPEAAEDVTAETFIQAWSLRARYAERVDVDIDAWLLGIATHMVARHRRAERRWLNGCATSARTSDTTTQLDHDAMADRIDAVAVGPDLARAIARMPARERDPLLLHILGTLSYEQVAVSLDLPIGTVRSRISRGKQRLRTNGALHGAR